MMRLKYLLNEVDEKALDIMIKRVEKLTHYNNHTEASIVLAKFMNNIKLLEILDGIQKLQKAMGYMSPELSKLRKGVMDELFREANKKYGKEIGKRIYDAF